ncbi:nucleotide sugar dehydrogenase [Thermoactinospora rubra]|uniref:nucleotide sugar dehydrogenase n=1 Tax=Thermoactinospora rubra TaxID=1088767 RepID=UPI000A109DE5|nr:nucleotide sugar dehydrogenase [Thermoactinospora rubra]
MPENSATRRLSSVAVIGMGYVGLPTALGLHAAGLKVIGVDRDPDRLQAIRNQVVDLVESDRTQLAAALRHRDFVLTADSGDISAADAVMVCVPTPVDGHLVPDLRPLRAACEALVRHARPGQTLILTSTSFVGTTARLVVEPLTERGLTVGTDVFVASSPERIDPGNVTHTQRDTPRVVGGVTPRCTEMAARVIEVISPIAHRVSSPEAAEMSKLYENTFRAVNIALTNEMADICAGLGLNPMEVIDAASTKPFGFMAFHPGPGVGGHCIPCDPHYLLWQLRERRGAAPLVDRAMTAIAERPAKVVGQVQEALSQAGRGLAGTRIVVVGVSYKPGVLDVRSSPALEIIELLAERGAKVAYHDPLVSQVVLPGGSVMTSVPHPAGPDWDLALVHTVHPGHDYGWVADCPLVVDPTYRFAGSLTQAERTGLCAA